LLSELRSVNSAPQTAALAKRDCASLIV